jgi:hypothetical protein
LAAHRQTAAVTEASVTANIHQSLDVHRSFPAQVTLNREFCDCVANPLKITVCQFLDLFRICNATRLTYFASSGATDSENGG